MSDLIVMNGTVVIPSFTNKVLQAATKKVFQIGETIRKCAYETAAIMAQVDETKCYEEDGFKSVHEWAMETFGFKKSASYSLLRIGKEYTRAITDARGKIKGYGSNIVDGTEDDFTVTQIEKMLPGGRDLAVELVGDGEITTDMTCKEIEKVIKSYMEPEPETVDAEEPEPETVEAEEPETVEHMVIVTDEAGNRYNIPFEVLEKYRIID